MGLGYEGKSRIIKLKMVHPQVERYSLVINAEYIIYLSSQKAIKNKKKVTIA